MFHVVGINIADALCNLRSWHSSIQVEHLWANLLHYVCGGLDREQLIVKSVTGAHDLDIIYEVRVDCW